MPQTSAFATGVFFRNQTEIGRSNRVLLQLSPTYRSFTGLQHADITLASDQTTKWQVSEAAESVLWRLWNPHLNETHFPVLPEQ
jgi:hypothetical protein